MSSLVPSPKVIERRFQVKYEDLFVWAKPESWYLVAIKGSF